MWNQENVTFEKRGLKIPPLERHGTTYGGSVSFNCEGSRFVSGGNMLRLWSIENADTAAQTWAPLFIDGRIRQPIWVHDVAFMPNLNRLVVALDDGSVRILDSENLQNELARWQAHSSAVLRIAISPDAKCLVTVGDQKAKWWRADPNDDLKFLFEKEKADLHVPTFSSDGLWLAFASRSDLVLSSITNDETFTLEGHTRSITGIAFDPADTRIATASDDGTVRLWSIPDFNQQPVTLAAGDVELKSLAFNYDGKFVAAGTGGSDIIVWIASTAQLADTVCSMVRRNLTIQEWRQFVGPDIEYTRTCPAIDSGFDTAVE